MVAGSREEWAPVCVPRTRRRGQCQPGGAGCPTAKEVQAPRPRVHRRDRGYRRAPQAGRAQGQTPSAQGPLHAEGRTEEAETDAPTGARRTDGGRAVDGWPAPPRGPRARAGRSGGRHCGCSSPIVKPARQWAARGGTCSPERPINRSPVQLPSRPSPWTREPSAAAPAGGGSRPLASELAVSRAGRPGTAARSLRPLRALR